MSGLSEDMSVLSEGDVKKVVESILNKAPSGELAEQEILKALDAFAALVVSAGLVRLFQDGKLTVGWNVELQDLMWELAF